MKIETSVRLKENFTAYERVPNKQFPARIHLVTIISLLAKD